MAPKKVLIVRTDRLGDVLLTTPVSRALRETMPEAKISWLVRPYAAPLLENNPDIDDVLLDKGGSVLELIRQIKEQHFDAAIVAYPRWRVCWALWRAGVPLRIGPASKWYSFLLNRRLWQHRSQGEKHEADFNLELLGGLGLPFKRAQTRIVLTPAERESAKKTLASHRISFEKPIVFLHPGSGGSSQRWPLSHFMRLGDAFQSKGKQVVVTGGPGEDYQNIMIDQMDRIPVFIAAGSVSLRELAALFSWASLIVSNSTGPLHMAVALGVPTVSVYSPILTCHPKRWGPYPSYVEKDQQHEVFVAPSLGENGSNSGDMAAVSVEDVLEAGGRLIKQRLR